MTLTVQRGKKAVDLTGLLEAAGGENFAGAKIMDIPLDALEPNPDQPRSNFDQTALQELADDVAERGVRQPIGVRQIAPDRYQIVYGERRWRASMLAGKPTIPAMVMVLDDAAMAVEAFVENVFREDMSEYDTCAALAKISEQINPATGKKFSGGELAKLARMPQSSVSERLGVMRLPAVFLDLWRSGHLTTFEQMRAIARMMVRLSKLTENQVQINRGTETKYKPAMIDMSRLPVDAVATKIAALLAGMSAQEAQRWANSWANTGAYPFAMLDQIHQQAVDLGYSYENKRPITFSEKYCATANCEWFVNLHEKGDYTHNGIGGYCLSPKLYNTHLAEYLEEIAETKRQEQKLKEKERTAARAEMTEDEKLAAKNARQAEWDKSAITEAESYGHRGTWDTFRDIHITRLALGRPLTDEDEIRMPECRPKPRMVRYGNLKIIDEYEVTCEQEFADALANGATSREQIGRDLAAARAKKGGKPLGAWDDVLLTGVHFSKRSPTAIHADTLYEMGYTDLGAMPVAATPALKPQVDMTPVEKRQADMRRLENWFNFNNLTQQQVQYGVAEAKLRGQKMGAPMEPGSLITLIIDGRQEWVRYDAVQALGWDAPVLADVEDKIAALESTQRDLEINVAHELHLRATDPNHEPQVYGPYGVPPVEPSLEDYEATFRTQVKAGRITDKAIEQAIAEGREAMRIEAGKPIPPSVLIPIPFDGDMLPLAYGFLHGLGYGQQADPKEEACDYCGEAGCEGTCPQALVTAGGAIITEPVREASGDPQIDMESDLIALWHSFNAMSQRNARMPMAEIEQYVTDNMALRMSDRKASTFQSVFWLLNLHAQTVGRH